MAHPRFHFRTSCDSQIRVRMRRRALARAQLKGLTLAGTGLERDIRWRIDRSSGAISPAYVAVLLQKVEKIVSEETSE